MKRIVSFAMALLMILPLLAGCSLFDRGEKLTLIGGEESFTVVFNKKTTTTAQVSELTAAIEEATGRKPTIAYTSQEGRAEILFGDPESEANAEVLTDLRVRDFAVGVWGGKYVIAATATEGLDAAADWFCENVLAKYKNGKLKVSSKNNYVFHDAYTLGEVTVSDVSLKDFSIVVPDDMPVAEYRVALALRAYLREAAGYDLPLITATGSSYSNVIRIGVDDPPEEENAYRIWVRSKQINITAQSYFGYLAAEEALLGEVFAPTEALALTIKSKYEGSGSSQMATALPTDGVVRVMFHNLSVSDDVGRARRMDMLSALYTAYDAAVIGLQGFTYANRAAGVMTALLDAGYAEVTVEGMDVANNLTPLFYRTDRFVLVSKGYYSFGDMTYNETLLALGKFRADTLKTVAGNKAGNSMTWAVLKEKGTGRYLLVASVGLFETVSGREEESAAIRVAQLRKVQQVLDEARAAKALLASVPTLVGGILPADSLTTADFGYDDLNLVASSAGLSHLTRTVVHGLAAYNEEAKTFLSVPELSDEDYATSPDRVLIATAGQGTAYELKGVWAAEDYFARMASPHSPVYTDFTYTENAQKASDKPVVKSLTIGGTDIENYVIVVPDEKPSTEYRLAVLLRAQITTLTGKTIPLVTTSARTAEQTAAIVVVANTSEPTASTKQHTWKVAVTGTEMRVSATSYYGFFAAQDYLLYRLLAAAPSIAIPSGFSKTGTGEAGEINILLHEGDVRIMENNVYGGGEFNKDANKGEGYNTYQRMGMMIDLYREYLPDVLGMQEYHNNIRNARSTVSAANAYQRGETHNRLLAMGYTEVPIPSQSLYPSQTYSPNTITNQKMMNKATNSTPIYYRSETLELLDYGYFWYADIDYGNDAYAAVRGSYTGEQIRARTATDYSKGFTWAIFRHIATGEVFLFASTHLWWMGEVPEDDICRLIQFSFAKEYLLRKAGEWSSNHDKPVGSMPIFYGGDFNSSLSRESFKSLADPQSPAQGLYEGNRVFVNLNDLSVGEKMVRSSHHTYAHYNKKLGIYVEPNYNNNAYGSSIDYIVMNDSAKDRVIIKKLCRVADLYGYLVTDHCPIFADITFKK